MIRIADYPQLSRIAWSYAEDATIEGDVALALYERNWSHVDQSALTQKELDLIRKITVTYGHGCFNPL